MNLVGNIRKALDWVDENSTKNFIHVSDKTKKPYNEVSGYFIPTLMEYGDKSKASAFAEYLVSVQNEDGSWFPHAKGDINEKYVFDVAQIIDGLTTYGSKYSRQIDLGCEWIFSRLANNGFKDPYGGAIPDHIYPRVAYCLKKAGKDIGCLSMYKKSYDFSCLSHFYAYGFEGNSRLGWEVQGFIDETKKYRGLIPEKPGYSTYCYTGLSQIAISLFLNNEYELGMSALEFVSSRQNNSGGFYGSNGRYFPTEEISWAVKFYLDAVAESQRCWFRKNFHIFPDYFEGGNEDSRLKFIANNICPTDKVLEVGSGKGRYINRLICERHACDIIDTSNYLTNTSFSIGTALNLPHQNEAFDVVFCCESLEHSMVVDRAIEECLRVVKPGGKLLIIDKDNKTKFDGVLFCEQWLGFENIREKYGADIADLSHEGLFCPFYGAKIVKRAK